MGKTPLLQELLRLGHVRTPALLEQHAQVVSGTVAHQGRFYDSFEACGDPFRSSVQPHQGNIIG